MRKWKDEGTNILPPKRRKLYLIITIGLILFTSSKIILTGKIYDFDVISLGIAIFLLWGIKFNGLYKIMRKIAEYQLKKKDNHWRNYP